jgi:hypothetical protein
MKTLTSSVGYSIDEFIGEWAGYSEEGPRSRK